MIPMYRPCSGSLCEAVVKLWAVVRCSGPNGFRFEGLARSLDVRGFDGIQVLASCGFPWEF